MDIVWFTLIAVALYFGADRLLDWIERVRGARFENRQVAFFAIILPLALAAFWLVRLFTGPAP
jgi:predicted PurR-regulated permease PerM